MEAPELAGDQLLNRAEKFDNGGLYLAARHYYYLGVRSLVSLLDEDSPQNHDKQFLSRLEGYTKRAEMISTSLNRHISRCEPDGCINIPPGKFFCSYEAVFGKYLKPEIREGIIEEPLLITDLNFVNLIMFLEFLILNCPKLQYIELHTVKDSNEDQHNMQKKKMETITRDMTKLNKIFSYHFKTALDETRIIFDNGVLLRIKEHGLHYLEEPPNTLRLGYRSQRVRKCKGLTISVFKVR